MGHCIFASIGILTLVLWGNILRRPLSVSVFSEYDRSNPNYIIIGQSFADSGSQQSFRGKARITRKFNINIEPSSNWKTSFPACHFEVKGLIAKLTLILRLLGNGFNGCGRPATGVEWTSFLCLSFMGEQTLHFNWDGNHS